MMYLEDPILGTLNLDCSPEGYVVTQFEIGFPSERQVVRARALSDGVLDNTRFVGQRGVTIAITLDQTKMPTQTLLDRLLPFLSPRYRPRLVYSIQDPASPATAVRSLEIRGADAPVVISGPQFQTIVCQWKSTDHRLRSLDQTCKSVSPTSDTELGRTYDLEFDRDYPASTPVGQTQVTMIGNDPADWTAEIVGEVTDPILRINNVDITFTSVYVAPGQALIIDTRARTMILGGNLSVYGDSNFSDWSWDDLLLRPGETLIQFLGTTPGPSSYTLFCYYDTWL